MRRFGSISDGGTTSVADVAVSVAELDMASSVFGPRHIPNRLAIPADPSRIYRRIRIPGALDGMRIEGAIGWMEMIYRWFDCDWYVPTEGM